MVNPLHMLQQLFRRPRLSRAEKSAIRTALAAYVAAHPVRKPISVRHTGHAAIFAGLAQLFNRRSKVFHALVASLGLFFFCGTVAFGAEQSLPGDLLYPVKLSFNETVEGALKRTPEAQAAFELTRTERRLEEAEALRRRRPALEATAKTYVRTELAQSRERLSVLIEQMEDAGNHQAAASLMTNLQRIVSARADVVSELKTDPPAASDPPADNVAAAAMPAAETVPPTAEKPQSPPAPDKAELPETAQVPAETPVAEIKADPDVTLPDAAVRIDADALPFPDAAEDTEPPSETTSPETGTPQGTPGQNTAGKENAPAPAPDTTGKPGKSATDDAMVPPPGRDIRHVDEITDKTELQVKVKVDTDKLLNDLLPF
jgi:hypothetical protein